MLCGVVVRRPGSRPAR